MVYNKSMKKTFVEKLDKKTAYAIIRKVFGDRFQFYDLQERGSKKITNLYNEDQKTCWAYFRNQDKYLNLYVHDTLTNNDESICLFDDKIVVLGDETINNNKHHQVDYKQAMFNQFGGAYKRYLHAQLDKMLEMKLN